MSLQVSILSALTDNYIYFLKDNKREVTAVVDPSEAKPVLDFLKTEKLSLHFIFNTHHHGDHTGGNLELQKETGCKIVGAKRDSHRIPGINIALKDGESFSLGSYAFKIIEVPGHTLGAIAYYCESEKILFTGDTLFSLGCGRLFEGTAEQMYSSLNILKQLPANTEIYFGHEYTEKNLKFALSLEPKNPNLVEFGEALSEKRSKNIPSAPTTLQRELHLNPFLKSDLGHFKEIREMRNHF